MGKNGIFPLLSKHKWFLLVLVVGLGIRVYFMLSQGLSNDELSALTRCRFQTWNEFWFYGVKNGDMHPAFYQLFLWGWVNVFGENEFLFRFSSLIFYFCNAFLLYYICARFFNKSCGLFVLAFYAASSFLIINTTLARPYNSGTFFLLLVVLGVFELKSEYLLKWKTLLILFIGLIGAMLSHYFAFLAAGLFCFFGLFYLELKQRLLLLVTGIFSLIAFVPHWGITSYQLNRGGLGWLGKPSWYWLLEFSYALFNNSFFFLIGTLSLVMISYFKFKNGSKELRFLLISIIGIYITAHLISVFYTPILRDIVFLFLMPFIGIVLFYGISIWGIKYKRIVMVSLLFFGLMTSFRNKPVDKPIHYGEFKLLGQTINQLAEKESSVEYVFNFCNQSYINYYLSPSQHSKAYSFDKIESTYLLFDEARKSDKLEFVYAWSNFTHKAMNYEVIKRFYPNRKCFKSYFNSGIIEQGKGGRNDKKELKLIPFSDTLSVFNDEFIGGRKISFDVIANMIHDDAYLLIESCLPFSVDGPTYLVAVLENKEGILLNKEKQAILYVAFDKSKLQSEDSKIAFSAIDLPNLKGEDLMLHFYIWNPNKYSIPWGGWRLFTVN
jgi:hypothetical protein